MDVSKYLPKANVFLLLSRVSEATDLLDHQKTYREGKQARHP